MEGGGFAGRDGRGRGASTDRSLASTDSTDDHGYLVDSRSDGEDLVVTADVPGVDIDDLVVGIDPRANDLVIGAHGSELERVTLPWDAMDAVDATVNNYVLEIRLRQAGG